VLNRFALDPYREKSGEKVSSPKRPNLELGGKVGAIIRAAGS